MSRTILVCTHAARMPRALQRNSLRGELFPEGGTYGFIASSYSRPPGTGPGTGTGGRDTGALHSTPQAQIHLLYEYRRDIVQGHTHRGTRSPTPGPSDDNLRRANARVELLVRQHRRAAHERPLGHEHLPW